jgi:hypothetical protein
MSSEIFCKKSLNIVLDIHVPEKRTYPPHSDAINCLWREEKREIRVSFKVMSMEKKIKKEVESTDEGGIKNFKKGKKKRKKG